METTHAAAAQRTWRLVDVAAGRAAAPAGASGDAALDAAEGWALRGAERVGRAVAREKFGHDDQAFLAAELSTKLRHQDDQLVRMAVAVEGADGDPDAVVGTAVVFLPTSANQHMAEVIVEVRPGARGRGLGAELAAWAEGVAREAGRGTLQSWIGFGDHAGGPQLTPTTGTGTAPAEEPGVRFALRRGYALEQVERRSQLDLPLDPERLAAFAADARARAAGYRVHVWHGRVPDAWVEPFAVLETRMSTDAPTGGLDFREDVRDAGRVRRTEQQIAEMGRDFVVTAAEHEATGELAAMTMLTWHREPREFAFQWDTIVLRAHRGHRLGMLVKAVNLQQLARLRPGTRRVQTWNAEENRHMLAINVALGFRPAGGAAAVQKLLPAR
ncbi:GNAT family N-acetyltransferase [Puerhibacterium puerhi]|uniref:GNAT family N-acetyltransferase n=1 Tax=Puerhibacterium puerhi TaxID=2692623 RepID=UPI00135B6FC9|nr:GNAT family N-acetyltransferase [Puerhibacterium puerhi]